MLHILNRRLQRATKELSQPMLRRLLETTPETVADFESAAEARYWDGCQLLTQGHGLGGVYLLGFAAEMILKHACLRADKAKLTDPVGGYFGPVRNWMSAHFPLVEREGYHSLVFWTRYLCGRRREMGMPLAEVLTWELTRRTRRLYSIWSVDLRYRDWNVRAKEAQFAYDDVTWLRDVRIRLWS